MAKANNLKVPEVDEDVEFARIFLKTTFVVTFLVVLFLVLVYEIWG